MNTQHIDMCGKQLLTGKFIAFHAYIRKEERTQNNGLIFYLKELKKSK